DGVALQTIGMNETIHVQTRNSDYQIFMLDPESGRALVQGGSHFAEPLEAIVNGSTFGGCILKMGWLGIGLCMELYVNSRRLVTTPIRSLRISPAQIEPQEIAYSQPSAVSIAASL
ncbi:MAG TPA: hypothetical protein VJ302_17960, partial [Blastocatellia bacterium]|nr:hypothetical protein [Blastocatellia bacterium]